MDEKKVLKKLEEIKQKRQKYKEALEKAPCMTAPEPIPPKNRKRPLTEEEIAERMKMWRETPDPACKACKICSLDEDDKPD